MSRVGKQPIKIPSGVTAKIDGTLVSVVGPKGDLSLTTLPGMVVKQDQGELSVAVSNEDPMSSARHGLTRTLINNMVVGVDKGFIKKLEVNGVGYRVNLAGQDLKLNIGYSHDVTYKIPETVKVAVEQNIISISGIDKQQVGQVAAEIRSLKKPEPYKGKGIKYVGERIIRKSGKSAKEK